MLSVIQWICAFVFCAMIQLKTNTVNAEPIKVNLTGKPTWQSSTNGEYTSDKAIDGCTDFYLGCCILTLRSQGGWWAIDLEKVAILHSFTVVNRIAYGDKLRNFTIYGALDSFNITQASQKLVCKTVPSVPRGGNKTITCHYPIEARFVILLNDPLNPDTFLSLCEVEIEECPLNTYGRRCKPCSPQCANPQCDWTSEDGRCIGGCVTGYTGRNCTQVIQGIPEIAIVIVVVLITAIAVTTLVFRKRLVRCFDNHVLTTKSEIVESEIVNMQDQHEEITQAEVINEDIIYMNVGQPEEAVKSRTRILISAIQEYMDKLERYMDSFTEEFEDIPDCVSPWTFAQQAELQSKNRYKNILPYDQNRVLLKMVQENPLTGYINASSIKDYSGRDAYIAALGPTSYTIDDTWRMIWEYGVKSIFMLTNLKEGNKMKCVQYWPDCDSETYGTISVMLDDVNKSRDIVIRTFKLTKDNQQCVVKQYHYISWPDKQVPTNISSMLQLRKYMKTEKLANKTPVLVHCSAGVGRTGTLIALDILMDQMETEAAVDVCQCVTQLRQQRTQMVQSFAQYQFLHDCLYEYSTLGLTSIAPDLLPQALKTTEFMEKLEKEFKFLEDTKPIFKAEELDMGTFEFTDRNRDPDVIPSSYKRVKLTSNPEHYINAVFVEGYRDQPPFCATQWPLEKTAGDFWQIILQEKCAAIVCLEKDDNESQWMPCENTSATFENLFVRSDSAPGASEGLQVYNIHIWKSTETIQVKMFMLTNWESGKLQHRDVTLLINLYEQVKTVTNGGGKASVAVMCRNGARVTGLYIGASILFDMINADEQVDVVHVIKQIRKTRPQFINGTDNQYSSLYQLAAAYVQQK